jgi:hypothetical protein
MNKIFKTSAALGIGLSMCFAFSSCKEQVNTNENMEHKHNQGDRVYACPMHPEVTGKEGDKCPKCGMPLEAVETTANGEVKMEFSSDSNPIEAGKPATFSFVPVNVNDKKAKITLDVVHEEPIHLIAVSEDLSWFSHVHPKQQGDGAYTVNVTFPHGGSYIFFADYKPQGGEPVVDKIPVNVQGNQKQQVKWSQPKLVSETDGYRIELVNGDNLKTGHSTLNFRISKNGKIYKATDMEEYLGAVAHIIMIGNTEKDFVHIHPESGEEFPITAHVTLEKPDLYRMWVQFNVDNKIITADFAVVATEGDVKDGGAHSSHQHHH